MGRRGRASGRRSIDKAVSRQMAGMLAASNGSNQPRVTSGQRYGLAEAINRATGAAMGMDGTFGGMEYMPRDPRDGVAFGPTAPLLPAPLDPLRPDSKRPEPRLNEYPVAWNLPGNENLPIPWKVLRDAADSVDIMRRCIEIRKEQLAGLDWSFTLDDQVVQGMYAASDGSQGRSDLEAELRRKLLPEIQRLTALWRNPWAANGVSFEQWCAGVMEDHLVADGVAIYPRVTYGGDVTAFELIDPTTIKLLIDYRGARPQSPYAAFQQILYGFPRAEFSACAYMHTDEKTGQVSEVVEPGLTSDQLYYFRENFRTFTPYGYSAVAQALISARLYLKRQGWMLAEYDDGSTPLTWLVPDGSDGNLVEKLTFRSRRAWEDSLNDEISGQTRARHRIKVGMPGYQPVQMSSVDERYKPEYDMHLIKMLAGHFGVTSTGLGFSESKGLGNSGLHEGQQDVQDKASTKPDTRMIERIVNDLSRKFLNMPDELRFKFVHQDAEDGEAEDAAADSQRARGTLTLNDDRRRLGLSPFTFEEADMPLVKVGDGWAPIEGMAARAEQAAEAEQALVDDQLANSEAARDADAAAVESEEDVEKSLELVALGRWRRKGGSRRRAFICKALTPGDFLNGVPADVEFAWYEWVPDALGDNVTEADIAKFVGADITKAFGQGNDNWRTLARDHRGRWVARGSMRLDALGPSKPAGNVLDGLRADATRRRRLAEIKTNQAARRAAEEASRPSTDPDIARQIAGGGIYISRRLKGMPAAARQDPPSSAYGIKVGAIGPDGVVTDDKGRAVGRLNHRVTPEQAEAGGWLYVDTGVPGASGGYQTVSVWKEPDAGRQLPANDASSTVDGMTTPTEDKVPSRLERQRALAAGMASAMSGEAPAPGSMAERIQARQDDAVRDTITGLASEPGAWVSLADVRATLQREHGLDRGQQDAALARMIERQDVVSAPEENQKTITDADRAAALHIGGEDRHVVMIEPPRPSVLEQVQANAKLSEDARAIVDTIPGVREAQARRAGRSTSSDDPELTTVQAEDRFRGHDIPAQRTGEPTDQERRDRVWNMREQQRMESYPRDPIASDPDNIQVGQVFRTSSGGWAKVMRGEGTTRRDRGTIQILEGGAAYSRNYSLDLAREAVRRDRDERRQRTLTEDSEAGATARADQAKERADAAQDAASAYGDRIHMDDAYGDAEREREYQRLQSEADRLRAEYDAAERVLNDQFIAPRITREREEADRRRSEAFERMNAERERKAREAAEAAQADADRKAREREENARRVAQIQAETRAELKRRTPEAFALMLDGGEKATTHAPSRKILADMREQGWTMTHMASNRMRFEAPDGRAVQVLYGKSSVKWETGSYQGNERFGESMNLKDAAAYVKAKPAVARTSVADAAHPGPGVSPDAPSAPAAPTSPTTARRMVIPAGGDLTDKRRRELETFADKSEAANAENIRTNLAELERNMTDERSYLARTDLDASERAQHEAMLAGLETMHAAPRGDAAVRSVRAARDLVERAEREGYIVHVTHHAATNGAPYFKVEALKPGTEEGFSATWHTFKGKNGSYGFMDATVRANGRQQHGANVKRINEAMDRTAAPKADPAPSAPAPDPRAPRQVGTEDVAEGDWRWNSVKGWERVEMISTRSDGSRVLFSGREYDAAQLGTLSRGQRHWIARSDDKPTAPPPGERPAIVDRAPEAPAVPITASVSGTERFSGPRGRTEMKERLRELRSMTRSQFDALPDDVKARITADLAHIGAQEDWTEAIRSSRFSGSRGASGVPFEARNIKARLTAPLPAPVDNSPAGIAERVRSATNASQARGATYGLSKDQLIGVARELGITWSPSWKIEKFRDKIAERFGNA